MQLVPTQKSVILGLLDACVKNLRSQGMTKMFIDGVANDLDHLIQLGESPITSYIMFKADKSRVSRMGPI